MLKGLMKDSLVYGVASMLQKLAPLLIIPIITRYLGSNALKLYDVAFVYAYLLSWLVVLGQDNATSIYYFSAGEKYDRRQVLSHGLLLQFAAVLLFAAIFLPFGKAIAAFVFAADAEVQRFWLYALCIVPAHIVLNYVLNILIWQQKKKTYLLLCLIQVVGSVGGVALALIGLKGTVAGLFWIIIGSTALTTITGLWLIRNSVFGRFTLNKTLLKQLAWIGVPFALTSFCHQLLPSIDRYFLLQHHYGAEMPNYILAVKMGGILSVAVGAFGLAFTPYSRNKLNEPEGEKDLSTLFRFVSAAALLLVPVLLLFRVWMIRFFADDSYELSGRLLPIFFFGWVFDLFSYFSLLGMYKSHKTYLVLVMFFVGVVMIALLNSVLVPVYGVYGAALSFCLAKAVLFLLPLVWLRRYFKMTIEVPSFVLFLALAVLCSVLIYHAAVYQYLSLLAIVLAGSLFYLFKLFQKHKGMLAV